jgi:TetR/AcrR family transcriptional regulator, ethionamide resistance regulator
MPAPRATARRSRRRGRRPRTYAAVLAATTELLETTSLAELTVAQILGAAGVGRTSFYEHFSSKEDVVIKLVRGISAEVADELEPMFERGDRSPDEAFADGLGRLMAVCARYAPLMVAATEEWPSVPELQRLWLRMHGDLTVRLATVIEADRAAGLAPAGADAQALAACLVWTAERSFHIAMTGEHPALRGGVSALVGPLTQVFVGAIYGRALASVTGLGT